MVHENPPVFYPYPMVHAKQVFFLDHVGYYMYLCFNSIKSIDDMSHIILFSAKCIKDFDPYSDGYNAYKKGEEVEITSGYKEKDAIICNGIIDIDEYDLKKHFKIIEYHLFNDEE